jgi:hypothetical protein
MINLKEDLRRWFKEKWTAQDGSKCGEYKGRGRVKCRPSRRVSDKSPQTWSEMSPEEKKKAVRKKQEAHRKGKQWSSHKSGKTWDGPKNKYRPGKKKMNESYLKEDDDAIMRGENPNEYHERLMRMINDNDFSSMDHYDRFHAYNAFIDSIRHHYPNRSLPPLIVRVMDRKGSAQNATALRVTGVTGKPTRATLKGVPASAGGHRSYHGKEEEQDAMRVSGIVTSNYSFMKPEHIDTIRRIASFRGLREMLEPLQQLIIEAKKSKKPYKGFKKGKNHPEGGLSRAEARRQGIHAGIETKDEAKRKGGFGKLSGKTQKRRKSFCARMCGMKRRRTSSKTANDPKSKINAALRVWGCRCGTNESYEGDTRPMLIESKNKPTNKKLWSRAKALARKKFDVYPSAYANAWAAKWYKKRGGDWSSANESVLNSIQFRVKQNFLTEDCGCGGKGKPKPKPIIKKPKNVNEEVVNKENKDTMTKTEIRGRDKIAKNLSGVEIVKKGDTKENAKYRLATYIKLLQRGKKKKKSK